MWEGNLIRCLGSSGMEFKWGYFNMAITSNPKLAPIKLSEIRAADYCLKFRLNHQELMAQVTIKFKPTATECV